MPNFDLNEMMRRACEVDREELRLEMRRQLWRGEARPTPLTRAQVTLAWVRDACAREGYPAWLIALVAERVQMALAAHDFPLLPADPETGAD